MVKYLIIGFLIWLMVFLIRLLLIFILAKVYKESTKEFFDFNVLAICLEIIVLSCFLGVCFWLINIYLDSRFYIFIISLIFVALIPGYSYFIAPFQYLVTSKKYYANPEIETFLKSKGYVLKIRIIRGSITNIYSTGIISLSKTIIIGETLTSELSKEELNGLIFHEIGHLKKKHLTKLYLINFMLCSISFFLFTFREKIPFFNSSEIMKILSVLLFGIVVGVLFWYIPGKIQYYFELESDRFSALTNGPEGIINALQKLDTLSDGMVTKGGINYPSLKERLMNINRCYNEK